MSAEEKRLHISPITPETFPSIFRPPHSDLARDVSFHEILTFPEKSYGFVTLPAAQADHLRQKFHGSVLRGLKMQVKEARAKRSQDEVDGKHDKSENEITRKSRRAKRTGDTGKGVLPGVELEAGRKVKRGWTEPEGGDAKEQKHKDTKMKDKKGEKKKTSRRVDSITGKEECLFKTKVPPNARDSTQDTHEGGGKAKKRKRGESNGERVVHEFKNTEKHGAFLREKPREAGIKPVAEYVDGKGWVDKDGNVVEQGPIRTLKRIKRAGNPSANAKVPKGSEFETEDEDVTSSSGTSSSEENGEEEASQEGDARNGSTKGLGISRTVERLSITRSSATPPPISSDVPLPTLKSPDPHPLETLFKRPAKAASQTPKGKPMLEVSTKFAFSDPDGEVVETRINIPQTPFTQQDIRQRRERSAAPTPDTAAPGKTFGNVWGGPDGSDIASESEEDAGQDEAKMLENMKTEPPKESEQSEFATWFYEHRAENNKAWKQRRREAAKDKWQSQNRKRRGE